MLTALKNSKRGIELLVALIAAVVLVPALANFQSINAIVNTHDMVIMPPIEGDIWRKFSSSGIEVVIVTDLARVISCDQLFQDVDVSESSLESLQVGKAVQYRLIGSTSWLTGHIDAVTGSGNNLQDATLVAQLQGEGKDARIIVKITSADLHKAQENLCHAGRKVGAKVPCEWHASVWLSRVSSFFI